MVDIKPIIIALTVRHIVPIAKLEMQKMQDKLKDARKKPSTYQVGGSFTSIYEFLKAPSVSPGYFTILTLTIKQCVDTINAKSWMH